jgi:hypothetical protein
MRDVTKQWIAYTNQRKQALDEAKQKETEATPVPIYRVPMRSVALLPELIARQFERPGNVHYSVPVAKLRKLAKEMGSINMSYREVGLRSFDYTYNDMVGGE